MRLIEQHYRENREQLVRVVQSKGLPLFLAEEVVQNIYIQVIKYASIINELDKWINKIVRSEVKRKFKEERHRGMTYVPTEEVELYEDVTEAYKETNDR